MAEHIICVTADGGLPLFSRTKRGIAPLPFPVMASLNGVHLFARNRDVNLVRTSTTDHTIVWKTYQDSIVLISMIRNRKSAQAPDDCPSYQTIDATISDAHYLKILDNIFHTLVLIIGLDELCKHSNVDRLKKDLRACHKLIDSFLDPYPNCRTPHHFGVISGCIDTVLCDETSLLQEHLNAFVEAASSMYGCLIGGGRVVCATEKWWMLTGQELSLLGRLIDGLNPSATCCDIPVYLPHSSANVPHRLLIFSLIASSVHSSLAEGGVRVCVLCGPEPSLMEVQSRLVERFWRSGVDTLQKCVLSCEKGIPRHVSNRLPAGLLAVILINRETCQCVVSLFPNNSESLTERSIAPPTELSAQELHKFLREFYMDVVGTTFPLSDDIELDGDNFDLSKQISANNVQCSSHYQCLDTHKVFALQRLPHQIFCLYHPTAVPNFALRELTVNSLDLLTASGSF